MPPEVNQPIWYLLIIAIIGSLPATLTALAAVIYAIKVRGDKIEAKVDQVKSEVDGKHSQLIQVIKEVALSGNRTHTGRKTDEVSS